MHRVRLLHWQGPYGLRQDRRAVEEPLQSFDQAYCRIKRCLTPFPPPQGLRWAVPRARELHHRRPQPAARQRRLLQILSPPPARARVAPTEPRTLRPNLACPCTEGSHDTWWDARRASAEPHLFRGSSLAGSTEHLGHMCAACPWMPRPALGLSALYPCAGVSDGGEYASRRWPRRNFLRLPCGRPVAHLLIIRVQYIFLFYVTKN